MQLQNARSPARFTQLISDFVRTQPAGMYLFCCTCCVCISFVRCYIGRVCVFFFVWSDISAQFTQPISDFVRTQPAGMYLFCIFFFVQIVTCRVCFSCLNFVKEYARTNARV